MAPSTARNRVRAGPTQCPPTPSTLAFSLDNGVAASQLETGRAINLIGTSYAALILNSRDAIETSRICQCFVWFDFSFSCSQYLRMWFLEPLGLWAFCQKSPVILAEPVCVSWHPFCILSRIIWRKTFEFMRTFRYVYFPLCFRLDALEQLRISARH